MSEALYFTDQNFQERKRLIFVLAELQAFMLESAEEGDENLNKFYPFPDKWPKVHTNDSLADSWAELGLACCDADQREAACNHFLKALLFSVDCDRAWAGIGMVLYSSRAFNEALDFLEMGLRLGAVS